MVRTMNHGQSIIKTTLVLILCFAVYANAIKCYQCSSVNDTRCDDIKADNSSLALLKECDGNYHGKQPFCRKTTQIILDEVNIVRVHRSCGWEEDTVNPKPCYKYETDFHLEMVCVCNEAGCNLAPHGATPATTLTIVATLATILWTQLRK